MQKSCHPTWKGVFQWKKCAIQRNKRDIEHEKRAEKLSLRINYELGNVFAFLVPLCPFLSSFVGLSLLDYFGLRGQKK